MPEPKKDWEKFLDLRQIADDKRIQAIQAANVDYQNAMDEAWHKHMKGNAK